MAVYGPIAMSTPGVVIPITIASDTAAIQLENYSLSNVLISVNPVAPQSMTQAQINAILNTGGLMTAGGWDAHIAPLSSQIVPIPDQYLTQTPNGGYWQGTIYLFPFFMGVSESVPGGTLITNVNDGLWITTYGPGEKIPEAKTSALTNKYPFAQQRMIAVPASPSFYCADSETPSAINTWTNMGNPASIGNYPFSNIGLTFGQAVSGTIYILIYGLTLSMYSIGSSGTAEAQHTLVRVAVFDSSTTSVGTFPINTGGDGDGHFYEAFMSVVAFQNTAIGSFPLEGPLPVLCTVAAGSGPPYKLQPQVWVDTITGGIKSLSLSMAYDVACLVPPGATGSTLAPLVSTALSGNNFAY